MARRSQSFICAVSRVGYLTRRPKEGEWPAFSQDIHHALKFVSEKEADEWLRKNRVRSWVTLCHGRITYPNGEVNSDAKAKDGSAA